METSMVTPDEKAFLSNAGGILSRKFMDEIAFRVSMESRERRCSACLFDGVPECGCKNQHDCAERFI